jgi:tRNA-specific 2-thiouridylase
LKISLQNNSLRKDLSGKTVYLGLSGGVDSSVAAFLLKEAGAKVVGVFMKNWAGEAGLQLDCPWQEDMESAMSAAEHLGIEFRSYNFEKEYKEKVMNYFFSEYKSGRTPNPDILCNSEIKFKAFLEKSMEDGAEFIATGHYAKKNENNSLVIPKSKNKDQTYFLSGLNQTQLNSALFPLESLTKSEVRAIAKKINLPNADKKDSQGICFIGDLDVQSFLRKYISKDSGKIIDIDTGKEVGQHDGIYFYTEGQREGLGIGGAAKPYYVARKDPEKNILYVAMGRDNSQLWKKKLNIEALHEIGNSRFDTKQNDYTAMVRYRGNKIPGKFIDLDKTESTGVFEFQQEVWAPSPGQKLVVFKNDICIGNATIS